MVALKLLFAVQIESSPTRPASQTATGNSGKDAQGVEPVSTPMVHPHLNFLTLEDRVTLAGRTPEPGSATLIKVQLQLHRDFCLVVQLLLPADVVRSP